MLPLVPCTTSLSVETLEHPRTTPDPFIFAISVPRQCLVSTYVYVMPRVRLTDVTISKLPQSKTQITY